MLTLGIASATTHVVNQTAPACIAGDAYYATIQAAVTAANPLDTIIVCPGTYQETVDVTKSDIVIKAFNETKPVVSANGASDHVFNITNRTNVTLQGFEIRDAYGTNQSVAGIYMYNASECNISNNFVTNISATGGYIACGVWLNASDNNIFKNISMPEGISSGGAACGLYLESSNNNSFTDTTISNVAGEYMAAGIGLFASNNNTFDPTEIENVNGGYTAAGVYFNYYANYNDFSATKVHDISSSLQPENSLDSTSWSHPLTM